MKRWEQKLNLEKGSAGMWPNKNGQWVKYEEVKKYDSLVEKVKSELMESELAKIKRICRNRVDCGGCPFFDASEPLASSFCYPVNNIPMEWDLKYIRKQLKKVR